MGPPVTFSLGMTSVEGSPPFAALVFDDGAAVSLHSVRGLAMEMGRVLPDGGVDALLQDWDRTLPALMELVQALAYDDRARGHRRHFVEEHILTPERLLPGARQIFRLVGGAAVCLPVSVQGSSAGTLVLDDAMRKARPNFCLAAVIGRMIRNVDENGARDAIAGWTLATELVRAGVDGFAARAAPGSLVLGPFMVPRAFAGDLEAIPFRLNLMGRTAAQGLLDTLARPVAAGIAELSRHALLLPGDVIVAGPGVAPDAPEAEGIDVIEAWASGFGRQKTSLQ
jgi:2-keto-4-pentenoate hydratase/2-oxohepta-3-ene-1,7-dioic acid hydratase in catechol pathway